MPDILNKKKSEDLKDKLEKSKNELDIRHSEELKSTNLSDVDFTHLHNHSQFSMLQSTVKIKELVEKAHECNMKAVALTDLGNMMGAFRFVDAVKKKNRQIKENSDQVGKLKKVLVENKMKHQTSYFGRLENFTPVIIEKVTNSKE